MLVYSIHMHCTLEYTLCTGVHTLHSGEHTVYCMAVGGTPVGPVLAGPILARASYIKVYILVKFILLRRKFCPKVLVTIIYYTIWYGKYGKEEEGIITHKDTD